MNTATEIARNITRDLIAGKLLFGFSSEPTLTQLIVFHIEPLVKERDDARAELATMQDRLREGEAENERLRKFEELYEIHAPPTPEEWHKVNNENERLRTALETVAEKRVLVMDDLGEDIGDALAKVAHAALATPEGKAE